MKDWKDYKVDLENEKGVSKLGGIMLHNAVDSELHKGCFCRNDIKTKGTKEDVSFGICYDKFRLEEHAAFSLSKDKENKINHCKCVEYK